MCGFEGTVFNLIFLLSSVGRAPDMVSYRKELLQDEQKTGLIFVQTS